MKPHRKTSWASLRSRVSRKNRMTRRHRQHLRFEQLEDRRVLAALFSEFVDPNPNPGNLFGLTVLPLSTGNVVVTSPYDDAGGTDAGAVYLFNGATGALISTLTGSSAADNLGNGGVTPSPTAITSSAARIGITGLLPMPVR